MDECSSHYKLVRALYNDLRIQRTIPSKYYARLEERLELTLPIFSPVSRGTHGGSRTLTCQRYRTKTASNGYKTVMQRQPHTFIPFILAIAPTACRAMNTSRYCDLYEELPMISYSNEVKVVLRNLSRKLGIHDKPAFKILSDHLFPGPVYHRPAPTTGSEGRYSAPILGLCDHKHFRNVIGKVASNAIENHPNFRLDGEHFVRGLVSTNFPSDHRSDAILRMSMGNALEVARLLFPLSLREMESMISPRLAYQLDSSKESESVEVAEVTFDFNNASIQSIRAMFPAQIFHAIETSELREWERERGVLETTGCVSMRLWLPSSPDETPHCQIRMRLGHSVGHDSLRLVYTDGCNR